MDNMWYLSIAETQRILTREIGRVVQNIDDELTNANILSPTYQ